MSEKEEFLKIYKVHTKFNVRYSLGEFGEITNYIDGNGNELRVGDVACTKIHGRKKNSIVIEDGECGYTLMGYAGSSLKELRAIKMEDYENFRKTYENQRMYVLYDREVELTMFVRGLLDKGLNDDFLMKVTLPRIRNHFNETAVQRKEESDSDGDKWRKLIELFLNQ